MVVALPLCQHPARAPALQQTKSVVAVLRQVVILVATFLHLLVQTQQGVNLPQAMPRCCLEKYRCRPQARSD